MPQSPKITDAAALKAMANPLRLRLYYALTLAHSATATRLAEVVDESVSLVSYHLRQLARHGYVEAAPQPPAGADGRERWWRPTSVGFSWSPTDFDGDPAAVAAAAQAQRQMDAHRAAYRQAWLDSQAGWSPQWRDAAHSSDNPLLEMTPAELRELAEQFDALTRSWRDRLAAAPADPDREHVMLQFQAFPFRP